jgi:large subunit ribosomal protein L19e
MNLSSQKRIASRILKCGISRVRIREGKEVEEALTREDIRSLIRKGYVWKEQKKGTSKFNVKQRIKQKRKGRMGGHGSRKGTSGARKPGKKKWIESVRPLRRLLRELKDSGSMDNRVYRKIYLMIKGGAFRNKKHLLYYLSEHEMLKEKPKKTREKAKKPEKKTGKTGKKTTGDKPRKRETGEKSKR